MPCLGGVFRVARVFPIGLDLLVAPSVGVEPSLIMLASRRLFGWKPVMAHQHHLDMGKPHIGAEPVFAKTGGGSQAFRRAGRREGVIGRKMRLAEIGGVITRPSHSAAEPLFTDRRIEIDAIVVHTMGATELAGEDRGAGGLTDDGGCDAGGKPGSVAAEFVEMRGFDLAPLDPDAVGALLVGGNDKEIGSVHGGSLTRRIRSGIRRRAQDPPSEIPRAPPPGPSPGGWCCRFFCRRARVPLAPNVHPKTQLQVPLQP